MLHQVTYEGTLKRLRRRYHARAAEWLIDQSGERAGEYAGLIGEHYEQAGDKARAAEWYDRAGRQAQDAFAFQAALDYYEKAVDFLPAVSERTRQSQLIALQSRIGEVLRHQARYGEAIGAFRAMLAAAEFSGDLLAQANAWHGISQIQEHQGNHQAALEAAKRLEQIVRSLEPPRPAELARALLRKSWTLYRLGQNETAMGLAEECLELSTRLNERHQMSESLNMLGSICNALGRYAEADDYRLRSLALNRELGNRTREATTLSNMGETARLRGDYRRAVTLYEEGLALAHELGNRSSVFVGQSNLAGALVGLGEFQAAIDNLQQVIEAASSGWFGLSEAHRFLTEAYLGLGKTAEALAAAQQALALSRQSGDKEDRGGAWLALGLVAARLSEPIAVSPEEGNGGTRDAAACFGRSLEIYTEFGMERERAWTLRAWAGYELELGNPERGKAMWQEAKESFGRLNLPLLVAAMDTERPPTGLAVRG
ncbi:MAG: tetratricopeptide repeat protein [Chloroflexi bacterium]|nr:tetratricopeptide repeat protein [Chloroflexota bacterium]MCI0581033.1 tetratricopeptide repeat protein [Chloroflexota bacterium]MCI0647559.1 tetratricopeptide repeat protein [Chloroflexota bacterium]MCI0729041.1 tetratricopeptide repeat protein [Chloroflexota bacterium]